MNFLETYNLSITTFSPVHIGCGEDYEPTNYVIDNNRLYEFDPVLLMRYLSDNDRNEFTQTVERGLREIQNFFYRHKAKAVGIGQYRADTIPDVQTFYDSRVGQLAQREGGGKNVLNRLEIARTAFNPTNGLPILPGSSIKGAIRTALLGKLNNKRYPINTKDRQGNLLKERDIKRESSQQNQLMTQTTLHLSNDSKLRFATDPFRFLKISDATFRSLFKKKDANGVVTEIERRTAIRFQVNRKKKPNNFSARGNINTLLECIPSDTPQAFSTQCVIEQKAGPEKNRPGLQLDFVQIAKACNDFYLDCFNAEKAFLQTNNYAAIWLQRMETFLRPEGFIKKSMAAGTGFLLRIGRHSGAEGVTVDAPRCIKIMKGGGQMPDWAQQATTLWLAAENKDQITNLQPFGWIFVKRN